MKADLSLVVADEPAVAGGVFTLNVMCAAPVLYCKEVLERTEKVRAVSQAVNASGLGLSRGDGGLTTHWRSDNRAALCHTWTA